MEKDQLHAFYATLFAICYLATFAGILADHSKNVEAIGLGSVVMGLIGMIKLPAARNVTVDNPPDKPVPVEPSGDPS